MHPYIHLFFMMLPLVLSMWPTFSFWVFVGAIAWIVAYFFGLSYFSHRKEGHYD